MTREEKLSFSWSVFYCYYEDTGRHLPDCDGDIVRSCIKDLSSSEFNIYTQFYNHADSICFYRESKEWQDRTDRSIQYLEKAAEQTNLMLYEPPRHLILERILLPKKRNSSLCRSATSNFTQRHCNKVLPCLKLSLKQAIN